MNKLQASMLIESALHSVRSQDLAKAQNLVGAKSAVPGFSRSGKPMPGGKNLPKQTDEYVKEVENENDKVSLHGYLKIPREQKLTSADLEKAERKATKEGNEAILKRIASSRRFIERKPNKDAATGKKVSRGFAVYRGVQTSPKATGYKSQKCVVVGWGYLDYYYVPVDKRMNVESLANKLETAFKANPTGAGVMVNELARTKKIKIFLRWDRAAKRAHEPVHAMSDFDSNLTTGFALPLSAIDAKIERKSDMFISASIIDVNKNVLCTLSGDVALEAFASGSISLLDLRRGLHSLFVKKGFITTSFEALASTDCPNSTNKLKVAYNAAVEAQHIVKASILPNAEGPKKLYKEKSGVGTSRTIETASFKIVLRDLDWALVKAVIEQKMKKALVADQVWNVALHDNAVVFTAIDASIKRIAINSDLLLHKLA
jgi:hypothetical protein